MHKKPKCIIVTGRPGAGKTTLSKALGERLHLPVVSRDALKEGYVSTVGVSHDELPADANAVISNLFFELVARYLRGNVSVIIEAAFQHKIWATRIPTLTELADPILVTCSLDEALARERYTQRGLAHPERSFFHGDAVPGEYMPPILDVPTITVATEGEYVPSLDKLVRWICG